MGKIYLVILGCLLLFSCQTQNDQLMILTEEYPPLSYKDGEAISGYGTDIVNEIQSRLGEKYPISLLLWNEAYNIALNKENIVIYTLERTPEREGLFYWIGPIGVNTTLFYISRKNRKQLKSMQDFKALKSIATCTNWFSEQYLLKAGFTNLVSMPSPEDNIKMVMSGKAEATILTDLTAPLLIRQAGFKESELIPVIPVMSSEFYIGLSKKTSIKTVKKWQNAYQMMVRDSSLVRISRKWSVSLKQRD